MGYYQRPLLDKPQGVHEVSTWQEYERWKASNTQKVEDRPCQAIIAVSEASTLRLVDEACGLPWAMRIACEIPPDFDDGEELNACLIQPAACAFGKKPSVDVATLELAGARIGPTLAAAFAEGLRGAASLLVLNLGDTRCRDAGLIALAPALRALPALESLDVGDNGLTDASAAPLSGAWPGLMALKLAGNAFADAAPEPASPYLEILDLSRNALGAARSPGVNAVAAWLASPGAAPLRALDLGSNALTMRHVERLLNAALKAPELRTLDLRGCRSTPALATSVARRTRFTRLDVLLGDAPKSRQASPE